MESVIGNTLLIILGCLFIHSLISMYLSKRRLIVKIIEKDGSIRHVNIYKEDSSQADALIKRVREHQKSFS